MVQKTLFIVKYLLKACANRSYCTKRLELDYFGLFRLFVCTEMKYRKLHSISYLQHAENTTCGKISHIFSVINFLLKNFLFKATFLHFPLLKRKIKNSHITNILNPHDKFNYEFYNRHKRLYIWKLIKCYIVMKCLLPLMMLGQCNQLPWNCFWKQGEFASKLKIRKFIISPD